MQTELMTTMQLRLQQLYELEIPFNVNQFLITDPELVRMLDQSANPREISEKLLICQSGEDVDLSLYLDPEVLVSLTANDPEHRLDSSNIENYLTVLEGVSHFLYLVWNARFNRSISLFEMELQAEVDKFVLSLLLANSQQGNDLLYDLFKILFEDFRYSENLSQAERQRYEAANYYAGLYCRELSRPLVGLPDNTAYINDLRRFYRLTNRFKIDHIASLCLKGK